MKKKNNDKFILITVPHAVCDDRYDKIRTCDYVSVENAIKMKEILDTYNIHNEILIGDIPRTKIDLNRRKARNTKFHQNINEIINKINHEKLIVIDTHSGNFNKETPIVLLNMPSEKDNYLINKISKKINIKDNYIWNGSAMNYITNKCHKNDVPAVLIEFNENPRAKKIKNMHKKIIDSIIY